MKVYKNLNYYVETGVSLSEEIYVRAIIVEGVILPEEIDRKEFKQMTVTPAEIREWKADLNKWAPERIRELIAEATPCHSS